MKMSDCGVYMILNTRTNARYVGGTGASFSRRWAQHRSKLSRRSLKNPLLQSAYETDGLAALRFVILETCPPELVTEREQWWMDHFRDQGLVLYNRCPNAADNTGLVMPRESVERQRQKVTGRKRTPEQCQRISAARHDRRWSAESRSRIAHDWTIVSPSGEVLEIHNLTLFAENHGLCTSALRKVALGIRPSHKGYRTYKP